jgi:hypothetical protein
MHAGENAVNYRIGLLVVGFALVSAACSGGGGPGSDDTTMTAYNEAPSSAPSSDAPPPADPYRVYAPLGIGVGYQSWKKATKHPHISPTHGKRFVEIYVNEVGYAAYTDESVVIPVGTVIVKTSWEAKGGKPTRVPGPLFIMKKMPEGYNAERNDWYYALHWEAVPARWQKRLGATQVYWRSPSKKVNYCAKCHDDYDREVGMSPPEARAW